MGYNTTIIVLNDALHEIETDTDFGRKLAQAVRGLSVGKRGTIGAGCHANAATAIETHHADGIHLIAIGGNTGQDLGYMGGYRCNEVDLLKSLADKLGYRVSKKPKAKGSAV